MTKIRQESTCLEEITFHVDDYAHIIDAIETEKPPLEVVLPSCFASAAIRRNKRCLQLTSIISQYIKENACRESGCLSSESTSQRNRTILPKPTKLRAPAWSDAVGGTLDLGRRPKLPPTQTLLQVRVLESLEDCLDGTGRRSVEGDASLLPAQDVEGILFNRGFGTRVEGEEAFGVKFVSKSTLYRY
jgi:hypothetical protein